MAEYIERGAAKHAADLAFDMTETEYDAIGKVIRVRGLRGQMNGANRNGAMVDFTSATTTNAEGKRL